MSRWVYAKRPNAKDLMKTWLITGASRGIGRELAEQILARGDRVAATLRRPEHLDDLAAHYGDRLWVRRLDVTAIDQMEGVVDEAFADHDRIDVVVSNAGYGVFGTAEDLSDEQVERMLATNLTGSIQLARRVVPHLRNQGGGVLVQLSSMGAQITFPGFAIYHATKWGVEGYLQALADEVAPFGIATMLVEPGMVRTSFYDSAERVPVSDAYVGGPADLPPTPVEDMVGSQSGVAHATIEAALSDRPPRRLLLNSDAYELVTTALRERLTDLETQRDSAAAADAEYGCGAGVSAPDDHLPKRPQREDPDPQRRDSEGNRDDQDETEERGDRVTDCQPQSGEHEPDDVQQQSHGK